MQTYNKEHEQPCGYNVIFFFLIFCILLAAFRQGFISVFTGSLVTVRNSCFSGHITAVRYSASTSVLQLNLYLHNEESVTELSYFHVAFKFYFHSLFSDEFSVLVFFISAYFFQVSLCWLKVFFLL